MPQRQDLDTVSYGDHRIVKSLLVHEGSDEELLRAGGSLHLKSEAFTQI